MGINYHPNKKKIKTRDSVSSFKHDVFLTYALFCPLYSLYHLYCGPSQFQFFASASVRMDYPVALLSLTNHWRLVGQVDGHSIPSGDV